MEQQKIHETRFQCK